MEENKELKSLRKLIKDYKRKKHTLTDEEKAKYLNVMLPVSKKYNIDLKKELTSNDQMKKNNYSNPLDNTLLLKTLIYQRYNNCMFSIGEINTPNSKQIKHKEKYNYNRLQEELINKIINILEDKITNYDIEDINEIYREMLIKADLSTDKSTKKLLKSVTEYNLHIGNKENNIFNVPEVEQKYKILLNTPNDKETFYFLNDYIEKCILKGINYEMIGYQANGLDNDHTILYASDEDLDIKLSILNEIGEEKINVINAFGTPPEYAARIDDSYYSIINIDTDNYIDYFNNICEVSYYRVLAKLVINKVTIVTDKETIDNFISLNNIEIKNKNPLDASYNGKHFNEIKDIINRNIPDILNTIKIYMEQEDKMNLIIEEFRKSLRYISNIVEDEDKKEDCNIAIRIKG